MWLWFAFCPRANAARAIHNGTKKVLLIAAVRLSETGSKVLWNSRLHWARPARSRAMKSLSSLYEHHLTRWEE